MDEVHQVSGHSQAAQSCVDTRVHVRGVWTRVCMSGVWARVCMLDAFTQCVSN